MVRKITVLTIEDPEIFDMIASGVKKYEGRKQSEYLNDIKPGDYLLFFLEGAPEFVLCEVTEIKTYGSIEEMVDDLWTVLVPGKSIEQVKGVYKRYYSLKEPAIAIGIRPAGKGIITGRHLRKWLGFPWKTVTVEGENGTIQLNPDGPINKNDGLTMLRKYLHLYFRVMCDERDRGN